MVMESEPKPDPRETTLLQGRSLNDWHRYLTTDHATGERTGHLAAPVSRYGRNADECAWWAIAAEYAYETLTDSDMEAQAALDFFMGLAINDYPDVGRTIAWAWNDLPEAVRDVIGGWEALREVRAM